MHVSAGTEILQVDFNNTFSKLGNRAYQNNNNQSESIELLTNQEKGSVYPHCRGHQISQWKEKEQATVEHLLMVA